MPASHHLLLPEVSLIKIKFITVNVLKVLLLFSFSSQPGFRVSDLGLHCLPTSHKKDVRLKWVKLFESCYEIMVLQFSAYPRAGVKTL